MTHFFVDNRPQPDGAHEVHAVGCKRMASDKRYLGDLMSCEAAVLEARKEYWQIAGCVRCLDVGSDPDRTVNVQHLAPQLLRLRSVGT